MIDPSSSVLVAAEVGNPEGRIRLLVQGCGGRPDTGTEVRLASTDAKRLAAILWEAAALMDGQMRVKEWRL